MNLQFAQSVIDQIHNIWDCHRDTYRAGYAVFYGPVKYNPQLMLIGLNPGGNEACFSGSKEKLKKTDSPMEYITYRDDRSYPLAGKTADIFDSIGMLRALELSVKTNLNFFRSKTWKELNQKHAFECERILLNLIQALNPRTILCESLEVFDIIKFELDKKHSFSLLELSRNRHNKRTYVSYHCKDFLIIGITHLTGSRPLNTDIDNIKKLLKKDFSRTSGARDGALGV